MMARRTRKRDSPSAKSLEIANPPENSTEPLNIQIENEWSIPALVRLVSGGDPLEIINPPNSESLDGLETSIKLLIENESSISKLAKLVSETIADNKDYDHNISNPLDFRGATLLQICRWISEQLKNGRSLSELLDELKEHGVSQTLIRQVAAELAKPSEARSVEFSKTHLPEMTEEDLGSLKQQTKANPWKPERGRFATKFIATVYADWLGKKHLMREHISGSGADKLIRAYASEILEHPERRLVGLGERDHTRYETFPDDVQKSPTTIWIPTAQLDAEDRTNRRVGGAKRQQKFRDKKKKERLAKITKPSP